MSQKISNKERARIFAAYWGAEIQMKDTDKPYLPEKIGRMNNLDECRVESIKTSTRGSIACIYSYRIQHAKLILKPLSEISDEDAIEVSKVYGNNMPTKEEGMGIIKNCLYDYEESNEVTLHDGMRVCDYLRSKSYDCGYGSIPSLISAGIAITETKK